MSLQDCTAAAVHTFRSSTIVATPYGRFPLPVIMVAIAGAESAWSDIARGDYGLPGPQCGGYTSWGLWQIHSVHSAYLSRVTGSSNPCDWAAWLYVPVNNAAAAAAVMGSNVAAGLTAWTTWNTGAYRQYLQTAAAAVAAAAGAGVTKAPTPAPVPTSGTAPWVVPGVLGVLGLGALVGALFARKPPRR